MQLPPPITRALLIACTVLLFLAVAIQPVKALEIGWLALWPLNSGGFWPWQLVTYAFVHTDPLGWFFNMFMLYLFGSQLEEIWGPRRYIQFLLACTVTGAAAYVLIALLVGAAPPLLGATAIGFGMLVAFGVLFPSRRILLYFIADVNMRTAVWVFVGIEVVIMLGQMSSGSGAWLGAIAPLGGALGGYLMILYWRWRPPSFKRKKPPSHIRRVH
jgi:membrane associated rhomboid family serine protease